jgi:hypothetical protein
MEYYTVPYSYFMQEKIKVVPFSCVWYFIAIWWGVSVQIAWTLFISLLWLQNRLHTYQSAILAYGAVTVAIGAFAAVKAAEGPLYTVGALQ